MANPAKFQSDEIGFEPHNGGGSYEIARRMLNISAFIAIAIASGAAIAALPSAREPALKASSNPAFAIYGQLEPVTSWNCAGADCDALRDSLWTANTVAHAASAAPAPTPTN